MLTVRGLSKSYRGRTVLGGIDLEIAPGEIVGLIGQSGAGKSTLARCLVGLETADAGVIALDGEAIRPGMGAARRTIQYLWQDPTQSLSPFLDAIAAATEPLNGFGIGARDTRSAHAAALLSRLGLATALHRRRPHALSGGQCQRVALARALAAEPGVLILDEPLSSLDLPSQIALVELLRVLHAEHRFALLIVSHDLAPLIQLADRILVLDTGRIVEDRPGHSFAAEALHPLARAYAEILSEAPRVDMPT